VVGIGVDVDQSKSLPQPAKCILTSAEKKLVNAVSHQEGRAKTDVGGTTVWDASTDPSAGPVPGRQRLQGPRHSGDPAKVDAALAGMKDKPSIPASQPPATTSRRPTGNVID
jgi:hypothetical protein